MSSAQVIPRPVRQALAKQNIQPQRGLQALVVAAWLLAAWVAKPFAVPLLLGAALAVTCTPLCRMAQVHLTGGRRHLAALSCTALLAVAVLLPLALLGSFLVHDAQDGLAWLRTQLGLHSFADWQDMQLPAHIRDQAEGWLRQFHLSTDALRTAAQRLVGGLRPLVTILLNGSLSLPVLLVTTLAAFYFFLADGAALPDLIEDVAPLRRDQTRELLGELRAVTRATIAGTLTTALTQTVGLGLAFLLARVPHPALFALLALPASFIPIAGSALVYLPVVLGLMLTGQGGVAMALLGGCVALSSLNTHVVKPLVVRRGLSMHTGLVFISILGGLKVFGAVGLILGPLCMAFACTLTSLYRRQVTGREAASAS